MKRFLCAVCLSALLAGCAAAPADSFSAPTAAPAEAASSAVSSAAVSSAAVSSAAEPEGTPRPEGVSAAAYPEADVTVDEAMYANWVNELTWNCDLYLEKTVRVQGLYTEEMPDGLSTPFSYVYRVGPGCCGTDGDLCGFQILLPEDVQPEEGDWIDVYGTLRITEIEGYRFLVLAKTQLTVDNENPGLINVNHTI